MSYSEPLLNQVRIFFLSIGVGVFICLCYVALQSFFRLFGKSNRVYYVADGLFCLIFAFVSFFFMVLYNGGRVRLHLILGEAVGFFVFYFAVGRYIYALLSKVAESIRKAAGFATLPVRSVARHFSNGLKEIKERLAFLTSKKRGEQESKEKKHKKFDFLTKIHLKN